MKKRAFIYVILAGILWGTSGIFVHYLSPYGFTTIQMTAARGAVCFVCLAIFALVKDRKLFRTNVVDILLFVGLGVALFFTGSCYFTSMQLTSVSTAVVLMYTAPVYVMIFSVLFLGERFSGLKLASVFCVLIGCCLVSGLVGGFKLDIKGILIGAASGVAYASYNIFSKIAMRRGFNPIAATMYGSLFMTLIALVVAKPSDIVKNTAARPTVIIPLLLGIGVFTFILPYFFYTSSLRELPAGTASALSVVEPMAATVFSVLLFREKLSVFSVVGIALILLAVCLLGLAESKCGESDGIRGRKNEKEWRK